MGRLPASAPRMTTSRRTGFRGCRYFVMFRPPSLLAPLVVPLRLLPQGSWGFYVRAYCASLPPHTPDMLTVRIQAIDGTGTFTLPDFQPCRLLIPCSDDFSPGRGRLLQFLGMSLSPCCRFHPAVMNNRIGQCSVVHAAFALSMKARLSDLAVFEATTRLLLLRPGDL